VRSLPRRILIPLVVLAALLVPALAFGHIERASYWPDPAPDTSVSPPTGGRVPVARSLASSLRAAPPGRTRVVCQRDSFLRLQRSVRAARRNGFDVRPTNHRGLSAKEGNRLIAINRKLYARCRFHEIQPAVGASGNNDRVVIMPGLYTEPTARRQPTQDPRCADLRQQNDRGQSTALSYAYQYKCPNDQNLIALMGHLPGTGKEPQPPREDRHGIPNLGPCVRCNVQIEGSGVSADDVVIDAGRVESGNGAPIGATKDVGIRADRADGFVLRKVLVRHTAEHAVYIPETDGYMLDRIKTFYNGEYGVLTFVADHGLIQNCDAKGNGDAGIYPGAAAQTGDQRAPGTARRYNQEIRWCDTHHNALGYSGTNGDAIHVHHNNFYDNVQGYSTDVFTAAGHPGFPQDSALVEYNHFYSNNFNAYAPGSDVKPSVPVPVGVGMWQAGGNSNVIRNNRFWDNWRRGSMLFSVPDAFVCGPDQNNEQAGCDQSKLSTSFNNRFYNNVMGVAPDGSYKPNGVDFWWDSFAGNTGNCWYSNSTAPGKQVVTDPDPLPDCNRGSDPSLSVGTGNPDHESELLGCFAAFTADVNPNCTWFQEPPKPSR
jgi:hypothetical protein